MSAQQQPQYPHQFAMQQHSQSMQQGQGLQPQFQQPMMQQNFGQQHAEQNLYSNAAHAANLQQQSQQLQQKVQHLQQHHAAQAAQFQQQAMEQQMKMQEQAAQQQAHLKAMHEHQNQQFSMQQQGQIGGMQQQQQQPPMQNLFSGAPLQPNPMVPQQQAQPVPQQEPCSFIAVDGKIYATPELADIANEVNHSQVVGGDGKHIGATVQYWSNSNGGWIFTRIIGRSNDSLMIDAKPQMWIPLNAVIVPQLSQQQIQ